MRYPRVAFALVAVLSAAPCPSARASMSGKVKKLLAAAPASRSGFAGVLVVDEKGRKLVAINPDHHFTPASNTKLFSTALALERLGPSKRFETRVEQRGRDLFLIGTGDANLSGRVLPYENDSAPGPPFKMIDDLAAQIAAKGIREVTGDIVGDDTAFAYEPFAPSWAAEDTLYADGAPVSALVVNDNSIVFRLLPGGKAGDPARVQFDPPLDLFPLTATAVTGETRNIQTDRIPNTDSWRVWGTIPISEGPYSEQWAVLDPAQFAALALKYALAQHNVHVSGSARAVHRLSGLSFNPSPAGTVLARHQSLPLIEDLRLISKISQNLHADLLLSDVAGSRTDGLKELARFLDEAGIRPDQYRFHDGSGLSRLNLVTPEAVVALLRFMLDSPNQEDWLTTLPISGTDGSLAKRMTDKKVKGRIRAKTGTLDHVSALSGYATTRKGKRLTFSIFVNNAVTDTNSQRELIDKICAVIVE